MGITILGTSHIAKQSIQEITTAIKNQKPDLVAVELDAPRAQALIHGAKGRISLSDIRQIGIKGFLFAKVGQIIQQKLGKMVGISPGSEMKTALELATKSNIPARITIVCRLGRNYTMLFSLTLIQSCITVIVCRGYLLYL